LSDEERRTGGDREQQEAGDQRAFVRLRRSWRGDRGRGVVRRTGEPVAILDVDYHHGNGTQQILYERGDVLCVSLHGADRAYLYFSGFAEETGAGAGDWANRNFPLPERCANEETRRTSTEGWRPWSRSAAG
jgi:hypothetical protein